MKECTLEDFAVAHGNGELVLDVREPSEYLDGHVPGAVLLPLSQLGSRLGEVPAVASVYVICASGNRSKAAADMIGTADRQAYSVKGGTMGWRMSGRPVITGSSPT